MASKTAILSVRVVSDVKNAQKGLKDVERQTMSTADALDKASLPAAAAVAALGVMGKAATESASELEQSAGAVESVFAKQSGAIKAAANNAVEAVGLSTSAYQNLATVLGAQLKNMGIPMQEVAGKTKDLISLGADLAATFGGSTADAVAAVSALLRGERDPIEKYGVSIKQADINARMAAQGLNNLSGEALKNAETQTVLALLTEQTAAAQGQFAREADTVAGAQQRASAQWEDAKAKLGEHLLPIMLMAAGALKELAKFTQEHSTATVILGGTVGALAATVLVANGALKAYAAVQTAIKVGTALWTAGQWALNVALNANPIGLVITGVGLLVAGIALAYNKSETFRNIVNQLWNTLKIGAAIALNSLQPIVDVFYSIVNAVQIAWNKVTNFFATVRPPAWLTSIGGFIGLSVGADPTPVLAAGGNYFRAPSLPTTVYKSVQNDTRNTGTTVNITVNGALDPVGVANQIRTILNGQKIRLAGGYSYA